MRNFNISHPAADALDWDEAMAVIRRLLSDGRYRDAMLLSTGCFLGLRISDILPLKWNDILQQDILVVQEKKTHKKRSLKINKAYHGIAQRCYTGLKIASADNFIFCSQQYGHKKPISRGYAHQLLKKIQSDCGITSARVFSSHSLRKTFGRRVWLNECERGRGEVALVLLSDVFGHSNVTITKRYLGIRQAEIHSIYDKLEG